MVGSCYDDDDDVRKTKGKGNDDDYDDDELERRKWLCIVLMVYSERASRSL